MSWLFGLPATWQTKCFSLKNLKIYHRRPPDSKKKQFLCYQCREQCKACKKLKAIFLDVFSGCHCWHHVHSPKVGRPTGTQPLSTLQWRLPPKLAVSLSSPHDTTLQWHPAMAPRPLPQKLVVTLPPNHSALQWHPTTPAMAPHPLHPANGTPAGTSNPPKWFVAVPPVVWK